MTCPDKGTWQAYLDNEVSATEKDKLREHAASCPQCLTMLTRMSELADWSANRLAIYQSAIDQVVGSTVHQPGQRNSINGELKGGSWMKRGIKKWTAAAASVAILAGALTFAPVQQAVADFLSVFRVQQVQTIKVNPSEMEQMAKAIESQVGEVDLQQFGKVEVTKQPKVVKVSLAEAQGQVPFKLKQPTFVPANYTLANQVTVHQDGDASFRLNVDKSNALLKSLGAKNMLPEELQGKAFHIHMPAGVHMQFMLQNGNRGFTLSQFSSPEVTVPTEVDPQTLRAALLDLPILPSDLRTQLANIEDWQHTLVIPETEGLEKINIAGHEAIFAQGRGSDYISMLWVDNGIIYQLRGLIDRGTAIKVAESLQ